MQTRILHARLTAEILYVDFHFHVDGPEQFSWEPRDFPGINGTERERHVMNECFNDGPRTAQQGEKFKNKIWSGNP